MTVQELPALNASLNAASAVFLALGYVFIRVKKIKTHKWCMIAAFVSSVLFLTSYLYYHYHAGSVRYQGQGFLRSLYFFILITHIILAAAIVPLVLRTLWLAWRGVFNKHAVWARWTLPLWLYVSATGVIVYLMLYVL